eukprot:2568321-Lingulodinium_polyedra.AAC.1
MLNQGVAMERPGDARGSRERPGQVRVRPGELHGTPRECPGNSMGNPEQQHFVLAQPEVFQGRLCSQG